LEEKISNKLIHTLGFNCKLEAWIYPEYRRKDAAVQLWPKSEREDHRWAFSATYK